MRKITLALAAVASLTAVSGAYAQETTADTTTVAPATTDDDDDDFPWGLLGLLGLAGLLGRKRDHVRTDTRH